MKTTAQIVRPRSHWRQHLLVSLVAFAITVAAVHFLWRNFLPESLAVKGSKAVAIVDLKPTGDIDNLAADSILRSPLLSKEIETRLKAPEFLLQALQNLGNETLPSFDQAAGNSSLMSLEDLWQGLSIRTEPGALPGENRIILELTLARSPDASRIARDLAEGFVREYRTYWAEEARKAYLDAVAQTAQAQEAHLAAVATLQAFQDEFPKQKPSAFQIRLPAQDPVPRQATSQTVDNPVWLDLDRKLTSLRKQEADLLVNKTPLHPEVRYIRDDITELERQLAATPRWTVDFPAQSPPEQTVSSSQDKTPSLEKPNEPAVEDMDVVNVNTQTAEMLEQLQDAVDQAALDYQDKSELEKRVYKATRLDPAFLVQVNQLILAKTQQKYNGGFIGIMLFSGFAMALGAGLFSSGIATEPLLATIADLELLLSVPIIGVSHSEDRTSDPLGRKRRQSVLRCASILFGGLIILGCMIGVSWCFAHLG